jgi:murein DD-endopeptidase MepM/ murein hydrolase activator NlpD
MPTREMNLDNPEGLCQFHYCLQGSRSADLNGTEQTMFVEFPLRGEWMAPNTPGTKVPSHGTNQFGERYAFDFLQVDWSRSGRPFYGVSPLKYFMHGVPLDGCYCWGKDVYAPFDGLVEVSKDGLKERPIVHIVTDLSYALRVTKSFDPERHGVQAVAGNYVILKKKDGLYAALVHLKCGSITVAAGQYIKKGDVLGKVGHSGNSTAPHLHFQLMDSIDLHSAKGIPCGFEKYEIFENNRWRTVLNGIPTNEMRFRFMK